MAEKPRCKLMRAQGEDLFLLSGVRGLDTKCNMKTRPGVHGVGLKRKSTRYGEQLREKQKAKRIYGVDRERQFRNYFKKAERLAGQTGENLLVLLETRLDNVVYRMGFGSTRAESRQLVSHGAILVNGKPLNYPSYQIKKDDVVSVREKARGQLRVAASLALQQQIRETCPWIEVDPSKFEGKFLANPDREQLASMVNINELLIVELYSK